MKEYKRLKDPIYGYIQIPVKYMNNIVDTATFQRLRRILQTSYSPLYSSAVHNRFVHSIGVYYLGNLAARRLVEEVKAKEKEMKEVERIGELFQLACLLHDVGHAPFSHTGEEFYLGKGRDYRELHTRLIRSVGSELFKKDVPKGNSQAAAPHEIASAIIGIIEFESFFLKESEKEFFARCITGYQYSNTESVENSIKNCFIAMLNSKVIDVDKLDYLLRDAYITGFDTVNIDYVRLIGSLTIAKDQGKYEIGYNKNAISVIENVVYAHDAEKKWIQSHPVVLYETYLLQHIIAHLSKEVNQGSKKLFSIETLSEKGQKLRKGISISLLCDDDIVYLMKNAFPNDMSREFFERRGRRHPVWKSEAEYKAFILEMTHGGSLLQDFEDAMSVTALYLSKSTDSWVIDNALIEKLQKEKEIIEETEMDAETKRTQLRDKKKILKVMNSLKKYADENHIECNFIILMASQFNSGFGKADFSSTNIVFQTKEGEKVAKVGDIVTSLQAKERERDNFFYLFYKRKPGVDEDAADIDNQEICKRLLLDVVS